MTVKEFIKTYLPFAKKAEEETGLIATVILSQAALETGWGKTVVGNMMFGVKDTDGINGNEQLLTTTEYTKTDNVKWPEVISKVFDPVRKLFKWKVKDYFRKYDSPYESFRDHALFLKENKRYSKVFETKDPILQIKHIALAGYATDPDYATKLIQIHTTILKNLI